MENGNVQMFFLIDWLTDWQNRSRRK